MPIDFSVWIDGVFGNARFIADRPTVKRVWISGEKGITSITSFDEAYEQLIGDLDAPGYLEPYSKHSSLSTAQQLALREYIETFRDFDTRSFVKSGTLNVEAMLDSAAWENLEAKARKLVHLLKTKAARIN